MADYGQDIKLGVFVTPTADPVRHSLDLIRLADQLGLDLATVQDHPYQAGFGDAWTLLTAAGVLTENIHVSANVFNLPMRQPFVLAKSAATLDLLTEGRVEMGIGAGLFWDAIEAAGGPRRGAGESIEALEEAVALMRQFWQGDTLHFEGEHYRAVGAHPGPRPAHDIPVWVGALKPRILRMVGRVADGWAPSMAYAPPEVLGQMSSTLDEAALAAGRDPAEIRRLYNVNGHFGTGAGMLQGTPQNWVDQLAELTFTHGTSTFVLATDDPRQMQIWAEEVAPALRVLVAEERASRSALGPQNGSVAIAENTTPGATEQELGGTVDPTATAGQDGWPAGLTVRATPDDGTRLTGRLPWDEDERPTFAEPSGAEYPIEPAAAHFKDVHQHLRGELDRVRDVLGQVRRGAIDVAAARSEINRMTLRQNNWTLGAYCENYCNTVTRHHTLEDQGVFPHLRRAEPGLAPVLDRLEAEHHVIHDVLTDFDRALVRLVGTQVSGAADSAALAEGLAGVQHQLDLLTDTLLSHFSYEERELLPAMARVGLN